MLTIPSDRSCSRVALRALVSALLVSPLLAGTAWAAETLWGLRTDNTLVRFTSSAPGTILRTLPVTGLQAGEQLIAIEVEAWEGRLTGISNAGRRYQIDRTSGAATQLAPAQPVIALPGAAFGASDDGARLMLVSETGAHVLINKFDGQQETIPGAPPLAAHIVGMAWRYCCEAPQRFVLDSATDAIASLETSGLLTITPIGPLGVDTSDAAGLEFGPHDGVLYAALTVAGTPGLYTINPATGQATLVGSIASTPIVSLTADLQGSPILTRVSPDAGTDVVEADTTLTYRVQRTGDDTVTGDFLAMTHVYVPPDLATPGQDFVPFSQRLLFAPGELEKTIGITIRADAIREPSETFWLLVMETPPGQNLPSPFAASDSRFITILDDDNRPPALTMTWPLAPATSVPTPTVTISGSVVDEDPGVLVQLFGPGGSPYIPLATATGSPFTFTDVALPPGASGFSVIVFDVHGQPDFSNFTITREAGTDHTYVLAEGATGDFFDTDLVIANPHAAAVPVTIDFLRGDGTVVPHTLTVPAQGRTTVAVDAIPGLEATSTAAVVTGHEYPLAVERTMRWDASGYGASTEKAAGALSRTWYFAEGSQGFFSTFLLLVNPQATSNDATVRFLRESGSPVTKTYTMAPRQRLTIDAGGVPELVNRSFGIEVTFTDPGMAERAMYFGTGALWEAGHESAGAPAPATSWYLAEGASGTFFETFILVANPSSTAADITMTFLPEGGTPVTRTHQVPANGRLTVNVEYEDARLANQSAIGTRVTSSVPVVVERSQYWPWLPGQWYEAHNSFGQTETATHWGLAEGRVGGAGGHKTYLLLTNHDTATAADVAVKFLREGAAPVVKPFVIAPASRLTIDVGFPLVPEIVDGAFGAEIVSSLPISVERAVYWNANGTFWAAGTIAAATRLP
jgi:hypothetical protein